MAAWGFNGNGRTTGIGLLTALGIGAAAVAQNVEYLPGTAWDEPTVVTPGEAAGAAPSDAVMLFDGKDLSAWENGENWPVTDGVAFSGKGYITTKQKFGDCQLHLEWSAPTKVEGDGQGRGNSGVFLMGKYEVQVLDSYQNKTYPEGQASSVYKQTAPMVNAMRKPGEWNTYDILWTAPRFADDGKVSSPAVVTVVHNGVVTLNHFTLLGDTPWHRPPVYEDLGDRNEAGVPTGPIALQDHGNPVRFRNIWVRELTPTAGTPREPMFHDHTSDKKSPVAKAVGN
ncbi:MAG: 3-keto-disaccharide hydrolase [Lacipirellulaceae bacterium]